MKCISTGIFQLFGHLIITTLPNQLKKYGLFLGQKNPSKYYFLNVHNKQIPEALVTT